ncbi:MAG: hypothetical protein PUF50_03465 [Erysipelotrichaceae bacterium]|nr:hypothetical protein [Erysipelotrichaceae bacterium]
MCLMVISSPIFAKCTDDLSLIEIYATRKAKEYINSSRVIAPEWEGMEIVDSKTLYDFNEQENGVVFKVQNSVSQAGYISVLNCYGELKVMEASYDGQIPFDWSYDRVYCDSPMFYFYKDNNEFISFRDGLNVGNMNDYVSTEINYEENISPYGVVIPDYGFTFYRLNSIPTGMVQPTNLTCTPTALAVLVRYLDSNGYDNLVASGVSNTSLINALKSSTYLGSDKTTISELTTGWKKYFNNKGYSVTIKSRDAELSTGSANRLKDSDLENYIVPSIQKDWPLIVMIGYWGYANSSDNIFSGPTTALHALTVYGAKVTTDGSEEILVAKDPWNGNSVELRWIVTNSSSQPYFYIYAIQYMSALS